MRQSYGSFGLAALLFVTIPFLTAQEGPPELRFTLIDGQEITLAELLDDGPLLVDFWALWCEPCKKEMRYLNAFHERYKGDGFKVLTINQDRPRSMSKVRSYVRSHRYSFLVAEDPTNVLFKRFNAQVMPTAILIDRTGKQVWRHQGYLKGDEKKIEDQIRLTLQKSIPAAD